MWPQRDGQSYVLPDTATTDTLVLDQSFFRPLGMQHFYDSFALVFQICVRRDALVLFGLNDDELLPDLRITRAEVLRTGMGAHQERVVNQDAQAADRKKVPAEVIQVASHEVDTDPDKDESIDWICCFNFKHWLQHEHEGANSYSPRNIMLRFYRKCRTVKLSRYVLLAEMLFFLPKTLRKEVKWSN